MTQSSSEDKPESTTTPPGAEDKTPPGIKDLIKAYTIRIRSIRRCAKEYVQLAKDTSNQWQNTFIERIKAQIENEDGSPVRINFDHILREEMVYHAITPHSEILSQSLFIFGFSAFDAYLGLFLKQLYHDATSLIYKLEEKEFKVSELMRCNTKEEALDRLVEREISSLLRNSYDEQFRILAERHGLDTLKKFKNWANFVEASQRRNLITHCNGVVNSQYVSACENAGYALKKEVVEGVQLTVEDSYLQSSLDILYEVGVKLGIILWRKACPDKIEAAEEFIADEIFVLLKREEWQLAITLGEFAISLPNKKNELFNKISRINYAQALKWSGKIESAVEVLDADDWSGSIRDLRLGVAVLREKYDNAAKLMRQIGKEGELVTEDGYKTWPVFREFRNSEHFLLAYNDIYGKEFAVASVANQSTDKPVIKPPDPLVDDTIGQSESLEGDSSMPPRKPTTDDAQSDADDTQKKE